MNIKFTFDSREEMNDVMGVIAKFAEVAGEEVKDGEIEEIINAKNSHYNGGWYTTDWNRDNLEVTLGIKFDATEEGCKAINSVLDEAGPMVTAIKLACQMGERLIKDAGKKFSNFKHRMEIRYNMLPSYGIADVLSEENSSLTFCGAVLLEQRGGNPPKAISSIMLDHTDSIQLDSVGHEYIEAVAINKASNNKDITWLGEASKDEAKEELQKHYDQLVEKLYQRHSNVHKVEAEDEDDDPWM